MLLRSNNKKSSKKKYSIAAIILLLVLGGFFAWQLWQAKTSKSTLAPVTTSASSEQSSASTAEANQPAEEQKNQDTSAEYTVLTENETYKVRQHNPDNSYVITLYAIINRPDQYDAYQDQLREYKQAALEYLKSQHVDIKTAKITYEPAEAADL